MQNYTTCTRRRRRLSLKKNFSRFDVGSKNAILLHDIEIGKLFGVDSEKIKSIARAETTVATIHSSTVTLPSLHLLYTRCVICLFIRIANAKQMQ